MKLTDLRESLARLEVTPSKSLGQNFLHDQNLARWIVEQLEIQPEEHLVEIGPGLGALTEFALPRCAGATLLEKDGRLAEFLRGRFAGANVNIRHADALEFDPRELFVRGPVKVLGNLPYYVSSQVLLSFTAEPSPASRLVFTLQRELAERLCAEPRTKDYGALTLLLGRRWRVRLLRKLPAGVFLPAPKVESAVVTFAPREPNALPDSDGGVFNRLVKQGFSQRRKQLRKLLALENWPDFARAIGVAETARAEELDVAQWIALANLAAPHAVAHAQDVHGEIFPVVDENDNVIGQASRHEVHAKKLLHRAVHIFVFNRAGELFLQKRSRHKDKNPGAWDSSAAGHVNFGDSYDDTAAREIVEELGVAAPVELVAKLPASRATGWEFVHLYRAFHEGPFRLPPAEIETGGFFPMETVRQWIEARPKDFARAFIECLRHFPGS